MATSPEHLRIRLLIGSLNTGGAEKQIARIAEGLQRKGHDLELLTLYPGGDVESWLLQRGNIKPVALFDRHPQSFLETCWGMLVAVIRLRKRLGQRDAVILYSMLYLANVIAWLASLGKPNVRLAWGIRATDPGDHWKRRIAFRLCRKISSQIPLAIANSEAGLVYHKREGFSCDRWVVIANGVDTETFRPLPEARKKIRDEWGISADITLIGIVARLDPIKDHVTFLRAVLTASRQNAGIRFVCVGDGAHEYVDSLRALTADLDIVDVIIWAGQRHDMPAVYNAIDIVTLASRYEGFPNVLVEAMACEVPGVATDVGDVASILDTTGIVVPSHDPQALAQGWIRMIEQSRSDPSTGARARNWIVANYDQTNMVGDIQETLGHL